MNLQERLHQCRKDIEVLQKQELELQQQIKDQELPKFGDIVIHKVAPYLVRVILYQDNKLWAFDKNNVPCDNPEYYRKTGKTIFDNLTT